MIPVIVRVKVDNTVVEEVGSVDKAKAKVCATMRSVKKIFKDSGFDLDIVCIRLVGDAKHVNDTFKGNLDDVRMMYDVRNKEREAYESIQAPPRRGHKPL